jgi:serine/threonine protein kinase
MPPTPRIGTIFAGYRIEALRGRGGMSVVYRAENPRLGNVVALKLLSPDLAEDESFRERFVRESRTAASIAHPHIIPIYDAGDAEGLLYIAMRYIEGPDLKELAKDRDHFAVSRILRIGAQVASALDAAHARGLIHRDVKPANILVEAGANGEDHAYLADFGLTKHVESHSGITGSGQFVGTIDYMAPEQIEGRQVDARVDVYALGCVLFECLAGTPPYRRETDVAVLWAHMREEPPRLSEDAGLPEAANEVFAKALAKNSDDRYSSCGDLVEDLRAALGETAVPALGTVRLARTPARGDDAKTRALSARTSVADSDRPSWRRHVGTGIAGGLLLGAAIASAAFLTTRETSTKVVTRATTVRTAGTDFLGPLIPPAIRSTCSSRGKLSPDFYLSVVCQPRDGADRVQYNLARGGPQMLRYFLNRVRAEGISVSGNTPFMSGDCSIGQKAVQFWVARGRGGHVALTAPTPSDRIKGDVLCHRDGDQSWIEWTDNRLNVYARAYGPESLQVYDWWSRLAGPRP